MAPFLRSLRSRGSPVTVRRGIASVMVTGALLAAVAAPAGGFSAAVATSECGVVVDDLRTSARAVADASTDVSTKALEANRRAVQRLFGVAEDEHPSCANEIEQYGAQLAAAAREQATIKGTPFWGPIGWLWNNVYYRVFNGNNVMMAMFGWALMLSPFILVVALWWTLRGAKGAFRRPFVPEHLRTDT